MGLMRGSGSSIQSVCGDWNESNDWSKGQGEVSLKKRISPLRSK
jgi:hypothetical protein